MARPRVESLVLPEDVVRHVFDFVRDAAEFLRFEGVCKAWRRVAADDLIWAKRPLLYGAWFFDADANGGRRYVLTHRAVRAARKTMRDNCCSGRHDSKPGSACAHVLGEQPLCLVVRTFADRVSQLDQNKWLSSCSVPSATPMQSVSLPLDPVSFQLSDGAVAAMIDILQP